MSSILFDCCMLRPIFLLDVYSSQVFPHKIRWIHQGTVHVLASHCFCFLRTTQRISKVWSFESEMDMYFSEGKDIQLKKV